MIITDREKAGRAVLVAHDEATQYLLFGMAGTEHVTSREQVEDALRRNRVPYCMNDEVEWDETFNVIHVPSNMDPKDLIAFCNGHFLDPGDYTAGKKYDTHGEACFLCGIGTRNGMENSIVYNRYTSSMDMIIYESQNFIVVSEKGAMKKGFLMICPKEHHLSVAQFPLEIIPEYHQVCRDVETMLKATYGFDKNVCFWEHGSAPSYISAHRKSIMHAHTHVLVGYKLDYRYLEQICCKRVESLEVARCAKYFCYHDGWNGQIYLSMDKDVFFPRQYVRKIIVKEMGLPPEMYDWRVVPFAENIEAQLYSIYLMLKDKRCDRQIMKRTRAFIEAYGFRRGDMC